jgi:hypothetical protein
MSQKIVLFQDLDGYQVIRGFDEATVDPMATWAAIADKLLGLDELAQVNSEKAKIATQVEAANNAYALAQSASRAGNATQAAAYEKQYAAAAAAIAVLEDVLVPLEAAYQAAKLALFQEGAVYSNPGPGAAMISDAEHERLAAALAALGDHEALTVAGVVADYRGKAYWLKSGGIWASTIISALAVEPPRGAVLEADLSDTQRQEIAAQVEASRIAALSDADKAAELAQKLQAAAQEAANKKALADITGDAFDARAWYAEKKAEIEKAYK